jgi:hypothetical protein
MKHIFLGRFFRIPACVLLGLLVFSCAGTPPARLPDSGLSAAGVAPERASVPEKPPLQEAPERPPVPQTPTLIMGNGLVSPPVLATFLVSLNPKAEKSFVEDLAVFYVEEGATEGVNHDIAFAQMCHETGYLRFGNLVKPEMNNFCGLGSIGPGQPGERFPNPRIGVRAHIQHLKAYAATDPLNQELVDPRFKWVRRGASPEIKGLAGAWAANPKYAEGIESILTRLYEFAFR